jgi:hypothetical protein
LSLAKVLDLRKKSSEEYAQDKRNKMSDDDGKQLSIEEATKDVEMKPAESPEISETSDGGTAASSEAVRKARATAKDNKKQLALEEIIGENDAPTPLKKEPKRKTPTRRSGRRSSQEEF